MGWAEYREGIGECCSWRTGKGTFVSFVWSEASPFGEVQPRASVLGFLRWFRAINVGIVRFYEGDALPAHYDLESSESETNVFFKDALQVGYRTMTLRCHGYGIVSRLSIWYSPVSSDIFKMSVWLSHFTRSYALHQPVIAWKLGFSTHLFNFGLPSNI